MKTIAPVLTQCLDLLPPLLRADAKRELRRILAVFRAAEREHDPRHREIANEDHSRCPMCLALAKARKGAGR